MPFDAAAAKAAGTRSGEARRKRKDPDAAARDALLKSAAAAAATVADIASGTGGFEEVKADLRFKAALVVLEYTLGRPAPLVEPADDEKKPAGLTFSDFLGRAEEE